LNHALSNLITKSRRSVTILFTDIVDSTGHWGHKGDIKGRLMVDQQNRLIFPVIKKFRGKVVKTIGDAVMATFTHRENAVLAAIGIQQVLSEHRKKDRSFTLKLRIGIHTGQALVEKRDVFGDTVNIASRIEANALPDEILISSTTATRSHNKEYKIIKQKSFTPKGKTQPIGVYLVDWRDAPSVIGDINFNSVLPVLAQQRTELFAYLSVTLGLLYFIFQKYLRYLLVEQERVSLLTYSPQQLFSDHSYVIAAGAVAALVLIASLRYLIVMPILWLRMLKGLFGYALIFFALYYATPLIPEAYRLNADEVLYESEHQFVEILSDSARFYADHDAHSAVLKVPKANEIYLQEAELPFDGVIWNKTLVSNDTYGWVERVRPPSIGVTEERLSSSYKFYLRYMDYYVLLLSLFGLIWGFFSFSVKPV
jgi:class 3 adenylate cyclase